MNNSPPTKGTTTINDTEPTDLSKTPAETGGHSAPVGTKSALDMEDGSIRENNPAAEFFAQTNRMLDDRFDRLYPDGRRTLFRKFLTGQTKILAILFLTLPFLAGLLTHGRGRVSAMARTFRPFIVEWLWSPCANYFVLATPWEKQFLKEQMRDFRSMFGVFAKTVDGGGTFFLVFPLILMGFLAVLPLNMLLKSPVTTIYAPKLLTRLKRRVVDKIPERWFWPKIAKAVPKSDTRYKRVSPFCISCTIYVDGWQHTEGAISFTQPESQTDCYTNSLQTAISFTSRPQNSPTTGDFQVSSCSL